MLRVVGRDLEVPTVGGVIVAVCAARSRASLMDEGTDVRLSFRSAMRGADRTAAPL